jgi:hypothetical protein
MGQTKILTESLIQLATDIGSEIHNSAIGREIHNSATCVDHRKEHEKSPTLAAVVEHSGLIGMAVHAACDDPKVQTTPTTNGAPSKGQSPSR